MMVMVKRLEKQFFFRRSRQLPRAGKLDRAGGFGAMNGL
jgi:hypothetical protein